MTTGFDLIILGGGIVGTSAAYAAVRGGARVALVDAGLPGRATDAGAGIISPVALDRDEARPEWTTLVTECVTHYRSLLADVDAVEPSGAGSATFRQVGEIVVAPDPSYTEQLAEIGRRLSTPEGRAAHGVTEPPVDVSGARLHRWWPELRGDLDALLIADVGRVDGRRLRARLLAAARSAADRQPGAALTEITGLGGIELDGATAAVLVGAERLAAPAVLVATGAWAGEELDRLGVTLEVRPDRGHIVHLRHGPATGGRPVVNSLAGNYLLGFDDRVVVGATHEAAGFAPEATAGGQREVLTQALDLAPGLATATLLETRVGFRPVSSDGLPLLGPVGHGVHLATGLGAWGLTLGPLFGELAAGHALGEPLPERFALLDPRRRPAVPSLR
jgi:D-amino-acid dehydrogenase